MPRIDRAMKRRGMKEQLALLQRAVKNMEKYGREEFSRGYELGGMAMKRAIQQAQAEAAPTKLDGDS